MLGSFIKYSYAQLVWVCFKVNKAKYIVPIALCMISSTPTIGILFIYHRNFPSNNHDEVGEQWIYSDQIFGQKSDYFWLTFHYHFLSDVHNKR